MKKLLSVILSCLLLLSCFIPAVSAENSCSCGFSPIIYVGPLGCTSIVRDASTENAQQLWKADTAFLLKNAEKILPTAAKAALKLDVDTLGDAIIQFVNDSFGDLALDENGNSKENVTTPSLNIPEGSRHGIDSDYYFDYDFRLDPYEHADRLYEFIEQVKSLTGHDSVKLKCSSMGGVVLSAYLDKYGWDGIDVIICRCCPLWGTAVAGELFCGKVEINATSLRRYAEDAIPFMDASFAESTIEGFLYALVEALRYSGVLAVVEKLGDKLIEDLSDRIFNEALIPIFGTLPGIWAFVPQEYFENAVSFMGLDTETGLYKKILSYRTAQNNIAGNLNAALSDGVKVCITCGYNIQRTPLVTLWKSTSDGTVDTKYASMGAVCGDTKEKLPEEYISSLTDRTYLSPDYMIDASACALKDNTWFFRDWLHCNGNKAVDEFYNLVMTADEVNISTFENYPQFMQIDDDSESLTPVTGVPDAKDSFKKNPTILNLVKLIYSLFDKVINGIFTIFKK
ncbi:MAG: hypothetical protein MJ177_02490 [Clostridia bacterium]|nr:hypothetical protein [Clostridia bacterium]